MREPTSHARSAWWLEPAKYSPIPLNRRRTPPSTAATPKEKTLPAFYFWRGGMRFEKGKGVFLSGFRPPRIRAVRTAGMQDGAARQGCRAVLASSTQQWISKAVYSLESPQYFPFCSFQNDNFHC